MSRNPLKIVELCDVVGCRKHAVQLILNDIGEAKERYCAPHGAEWRASNKKQAWTCWEIGKDGQPQAEILDNEGEPKRRFASDNDSIRSSQGAADLSRNDAASNDRGREDGSGAVPRSLVPTREKAAGVRQVTGDTRELAPPPTGVGFGGAGQLELTDQQCHILMSSVNPDLVDIRPDGLLYLPQIHYRRILNLAFRPGGWAMVPQNKPVIQDSRVIIHYHLYVNGLFAAEAVGSMEYFAKSFSSHWDDCVEGSKSDALTRCCKDLGVASELWDWRYAQDWKREYAVLVHVETKKGPSRWWRHKDKDPFREEVKPGRAQESAYRKPPNMKEEFDAHFDSID